MIVTSKFPSVAVPDVSLATLMLETFDRHGDAVAVVGCVDSRLAFHRNDARTDGDELCSPCRLELPLVPLE